MQYGYSIRILEDDAGVEVTTHTKTGRECTVRITKTDKWVDKDKGVRQAQVKYTKDLALRTFNERF